MRDPVDSLIVDLLEWIGPQGRPYAEVIDAWRTSCPRLPVWEEADARGYIVREHAAQSGTMISASASGAALLMAHKAPLPEHSRRNATKPVQQSSNQEERR